MSWSRVTKRRIGRRGRFRVISGSLLTSLRLAARRAIMGTSGACCAQSLPNLEAGRTLRLGYRLASHPPRLSRPALSLPSEVNRSNKPVWFGAVLQQYQCVDACPA